MATKITRNEKAVLRSVLDSIEIDVTQAKNGDLPLEDLLEQTQARIQVLRTDFQL